MGDQLLEQVSIVDHIRHQRPNLLILVETQRETLHMLVDVLAHIRHHAPTGNMRQVRTQELHDRPGNVDNQNDDRKSE